MSHFVPSAHALVARVLAPFVPREDALRRLPAVVAIVRVLLGAMVVHQALDLFGYAVVGVNDSAAFRPVTLTLAALGVLLTLGLGTPAVVVALLAFYGLKPVVHNLGTQVTAITLWGLLFLGAGKAWSLDARMLPAGARAWLYGLAVDERPLGVAATRFLVLLLFWGVCVNAMLHHFGDEFWLSGHVLQYAFTGPFISDHYAAAAAFRDAWPWAFATMCQVGLAVQAGWELLLLPLMYHRWTRAFAVVQGVLFFLSALVLFNLQYLPVAELLMWGLLFGAGLAAGPPPAAGERVSPPLAAAIALGGAAVFLHNVGVPGVPGNMIGLTEAVRHGLPGFYDLFGQKQVNVFNRKDVGMCRAHLVIREVDERGRQLRVVPYLDHEGGRLDYLRNDYLYFGWALRWQRAAWRDKFIDGDPSRPGPPTERLLRKVASLDAALTGPDRPRRYEGLVFTREMVDDVTPPRWSPARYRGKLSLTLGPAELEPLRALAPQAFVLPPGQAGAARRLAAAEAALAGLQ